MEDGKAFNFNCPAPVSGAYYYCRQQTKENASYQEPARVGKSHYAHQNRPHASQETGCAVADAGIFAANAVHGYSGMRQIALSLRDRWANHNFPTLMVRLFVFGLVRNARS